MPRRKQALFWAAASGPVCLNPDLDIPSKHVKIYHWSILNIATLRNIDSLAHTVFCNVMNNYYIIIESRATTVCVECTFRHNLLHSDRENITLGDIPFVQEWWKDQ